MPLELRLTFPDPAHVSVALLGNSPDFSQPAEFISPLTEDDLKELRWYVEDYGTGYRAEPDDARAKIVRNSLPKWGAKLFAAVFKSNDKAGELFRRFLDAREEGRVLSIAADHPAVLSLPWELLAAPGGSFLFNENPPISIRRGLPAAKQECAQQPCAAKPVLHLLFIISRPEGAGFLNPRSDAQAVLNALEQQKQVRVEVEFLRLATLAELKKRLHDRTKAPVDIIHFDGHGVLASSATDDRKQGWLLFEGEWGGTKKVSGKAFGELLNSSHTGLVVLSACQSAMMDSKDPMSSVAAQLVHAGIPTVIAMSYSTLVATTEQLFAEFYRSLFEGRSVASSLDEARHALRCNPERGIRLRGPDRSVEKPLELHDWFLPALYQSGNDMALLSAAADDSLLPNAAPLHNLPDVQESGFFGRSWELWQIERFFAVNHCRRISITGFGGQGKTALACEAGRWLLRTKLFKRACLVRFDSYQGSDPVSMAISTMSAVFEESLLDAAAAEDALKRVPTLLILDNLESLAESGALAELLDAAAKWSEAGESRVLLTSRQPDFQHPAYPLAGSYDHRHIALQGLREDDAVNWFDEMYRLLPETDLKRPRRDDLVRLFEQVGFHPLSISLLAQQLKECGPADVGERLEALLALQPVNQQDRSLLASLELSIERLPERCRKWLPRLGVFAGGGLEEIVVKVAGMEAYPSEWSILRRHLMLSGLMQAERIPKTNATWLCFHPTLAPAMWQRIDDEKEQTRLLESHWRAYYALSNDLPQIEHKNIYVSHIIARFELANLLQALKVCLKTGQEEGQYFADNVNPFLMVFGLRREHQAIVEVISKTGNKVDSRSCYMAHCTQGQQLLNSGQTEQAGRVFIKILKELGQEPSYERCRILYSLSCCHRAQGQPDEAENLLNQTFSELTSLDHQSKQVWRLNIEVKIELADMLTDRGDYIQAKQVYHEIWAALKHTDDTWLFGTMNAKLGNLALAQNELDEAGKQYQRALDIFRHLKRPNDEAIVQHSLGLVYQRKGHWEKAEKAYRDSARLDDEVGNLKGVSRSWNRIAQLCENTGRLTEAETWYRKTLDVFKEAGVLVEVAKVLNDFADLLVRYPTRLEEARSMAEDSLAIKEKFNPVAAEIWTTYNILARIATKQGDSRHAAAYRAKSRQAYFAFPGWRQRLYQNKPLIAAVVQATTNPVLRAVLEQALAQTHEESQVNFAAAVHCILSGERDEVALIGPLNYMEAAVIRAILEGIAETR